MQTRKLGKRRSATHAVLWQPGGVVGKSSYAQAGHRLDVPVTWYGSPWASKPEEASWVRGRAAYPCAPRQHFHVQHAPTHILMRLQMRKREREMGFGSVSRAGHPRGRCCAGSGSGGVPGDREAGQVGVPTVPRSCGDPGGSGGGKEGAEAGRRRWGRCAGSRACRVEPLSAGWSPWPLAADIWVCN